jgi:hypothetical protein
MTKPPTSLASQSTACLEDRRRRRSDDPLIALHYQLSHARHDGELDAIVLADTAGVVVAGAGAWAVCEEIAAYAPLMAQGVVWNESGSTRMAALASEVDVVPMSVDGMDVYLCSRATPSRSSMREPAMARAAKGITRILRAA